MSLVYSSSQPSVALIDPSELLSITVSATTDVPRYDDDLEYPFSYEEPEENYFNVPKGE